jgi:prepilin-type N-terminal cleavage/methylation domain-containing protein/prepilin-type processing-associated H-X9-DG protein
MISVAFPSRPTVRQTGFTLVELLTVLAIIAVIASIAVPAFSNLQKAGRNTETLSNLRSIQAANQLYANDHQRVYVPPVTVNEEGNPDTENGLWFENEDFLYYLGDSDEVLRSGQTVREPEYSIGMNVTQSTNDVRDHLDPAWEVHEMKVLDNSDRLMAFAEAADHFVKYDKRLEWENDEKLPLEFAIARRYNKRTPVVFYDGHVDMLEKEDVEEMAYWFYDGGPEEEEPGEDEEEEGDGPQEE